MSGDINYSAQLPSTNFTAGGEIPVSWHVENGSGKRATLSCSLQEKIMYLAAGRIRRDVKTLASRSDITVPPHSVSGDITMLVPIPPCRPAMTRSNVIKSKFLLVATVVIPWAINSHIEIPVKIGNQSFNQ